MTHSRKVDWKWLLIAGLFVGWSSTIYILGMSILDQRSRFSGRNEIDIFAEFSLAAGAPIQQIATDFEHASKAVAVCFGDLAGVKNFLNSMNENKLLNDVYFHRFDSDDNIARIVLIYANQNYRIFYMQYLSIDGLDNQVGCNPINQVNWKITPPKIINGQPKLGEIR